MIDVIILWFCILCLTLGIKELFGYTDVIIDEESSRQYDIDMEYIGL
jgi:hypothetical protein